MEPVSESVQESVPEIAPPGLGASVQLLGPQRFLRSADPMPMLRPPDLVDPGEVGQVVEVRALGQLAVRFRRGTYLIDAAQLREAH
jgi:hypothetical protein